MKLYQIMASICLFSCPHYSLVHNIVAQEASPGLGIVVRVSPTNLPVTVAGPTGNLSAISRRFYFERASKPEQRAWPDELVSIYVPATGAAWTGQTNDCYLAVLEGCIIGYSPLVGSTLRAIISTNQYASGLTNVDEVFKAERYFYCNLKRNNGYMDPYVISVRGLFENLPEEVRYRVFSDAAGCSGMKTSVSVVGPNAVVTFQIETNLVGKVAFNNKLEPIWATTNGVPFGPIPSNSVFFSQGITIPRK